MPIQVSSPPPLPVWDCHICGAPEAFVGQPDACTTVMYDEYTTGGYYHEDGTLCCWIQYPGGQKRPWNPWIGGGK